MEENYSEANTGNIVWGFLTGLLVGGLIGAGTMLLFAPQSGKKTREQIRLKGIELRDQTTGAFEDAISQTRDKVRLVTNRVQEEAGKMEKRSKALINGAKEGIENSRKI
jgi:gas vesicle protein